MNMTERDLADLEHAFGLLEQVTLAVRISNMLGVSIEKGFRLLPGGWTERVRRASHHAIAKALDLAVLTLEDRKLASSSDRLHKLAAAASGAAGGALGLPGISLELPVSTAVMLRSVADIARSEGEGVRSLETKLACLEVFALGSASARDDEAETGYFAFRAALANSVTDAARHIARHGLVDPGAPVVVRLVSRISARYGLVVSEKAAAQAIPLLGAAGGALVNTLFIDHFQNAARGHFVVRRLERAYGRETVRRAYESLRERVPAPVPLSPRSPGKA